MMKKDYIIWGISDRGYQESISSSFTENKIPSEFKASVSDKHRTIANYFSQDNNGNDYFYSIERVGNNVLYTIYRTNWYRDSRLSYDAATIIIDKNHIIENSLHSLKLLIKQYITQKESGIREFNFENVIAQIKLRKKHSNEKRPISKKYKEGYIKYQSETGLNNSSFSDTKDILHNFNKVFFFTSLKYLETGANKLQNVSTYKEIPIRLVNYDTRYYRIDVNNNQVNIFGNTFNAYEGDEIKIYKSTGNIPQKVYIAKEGLSIPLKKIVPKQPVHNIQNRRNNREKKQKEYLIIGGLSLVILVVLGFVFQDILFGGGEGGGKPNLPQETIANCKIEFADNKFTDQNGKEKTDANELLDCFKDKNGWIKFDDKKYQLDDKEHKIKQKKDKKWIVVKSNDELNNLRKELKKNDKKKVSKEVIGAIEKIINLQELIDKIEGLEGNNYTWIWIVNKKGKYVLKMKKTEGDEDFTKSIEFIKHIENVKSLLSLLEDVKPIPASVLEDIKIYIKENGSKEVKKFLKTQKQIEELKKGAEETKSGLAYKEIASGEGTGSPNKQSTVTIHYEGKLIDGTVFKESGDKGKTAELKNFDIKGLIEGIQLMHIGDKWLFIIPPDLAYGEKGKKKYNIGPNETLIFEVELLNIVGKKKKEEVKKKKKEEEEEEEEDNNDPPGDECTFNHKYTIDDVSTMVDDANEKLAKLDDRSGNLSANDRTILKDQVKGLCQDLKDLKVYLEYSCECNEGKSQLNYLEELDCP